MGWLFRYGLVVAVLLLIGVYAVGRGVYRHFAEDLPPFEAIADYQAEAPGVTRIYANDGTLLAELAVEHRSYATYDQMPDQLVDAFLAAEDRRFWEHQGLDFRGLTRAIVVNIRSGSLVQGGSTITQQVAKQFLSHDRTLSRKLSEAILSLRMESRLDKSAILEIYMNKIFLGHGAYGVAAAAGRYFDKELEELTLAECALIAGLANAPSRYSPVSSPERAKERRAVVLQDMVEAGYITPEQRDEASEEPIVLAERPDPFRVRAPHYAEQVRRSIAERYGEQAVLAEGFRIETAADLQMQVWAHDAIDHALRKMDHRQGFRGPEAHLPDPADQETFLARARTRYGAAPLDDHHRLRLALVTEVKARRVDVKIGDTVAYIPLNKMNWASPYDSGTGKNDVTINNAGRALEVGDVIWVRPVLSKVVREDDGGPHLAQDENQIPMVALEQTPRVEAALYTFDHRTGYVSVMEGGHDYDRSQFNRTTQACRQPGSVFKAVYYALALDTRQYQMDSVLEGKPWEPEEGEEWNPRNIDKTLDGKVLLRTALIKSMNTPSIRLFLRLGAPKVVAWARRLGFESELIADKALSLGASCVRAEELVRAFGIYVRGGVQVEPTYIRRIVDKRGRVVEDNRAPMDPLMDTAGRIDAVSRRAVEGPEQLIDVRTAFLITRLLREVVTAGIGARANKIGVPAGGKSGTASKGAFTTDTWFVGFTSRHVTSAWMGDDKYERSLGDEDASYTTATPMWTRYMGNVVKGLDHAKLPLEKPSGIQSKVVDATHGGTPVAGLPQATVYYVP